MSRRKNDVFAQATVGLFMVVVVALLAYFTIVISGVDVLMGRDRTRITILFDQVGGLKDHDNVMYRGTKVGVVDRVVVTPTNLQVIAEIDGQVVLRDSYRIAVCSLSMLGGNYMMLEEGTGRQLELTSTVFRGETPTDWMKDVSRIAKNMNELMERKELREIVSNACLVAARARAIAEKTELVVTRIERGEGTVGRLMSADNSLYASMEHTVNNARDVTDKIVKGESLAGKLLAKDDGLYDELKASVAAFKKACASLDMGNTKENVRAFVEKGNRLADNLNAVAENLRAGKGTLGRLAGEDKMYQEVEGLIRDCRQIIDNYRDTTPISTFSSLATGAL